MEPIKNNNTGKKYTTEENEYLLENIKEGIAYGEWKQLAENLGRTVVAIQLQFLKLINENYPSSDILETYNIERKYISKYILLS